MTTRIIVAVWTVLCLVLAGAWWKAENRTITRSVNASLLVIRCDHSDHWSCR